MTAIKYAWCVPKTICENGELKKKIWKNNKNRHTPLFTPNELSTSKIMIFILRALFGVFTLLC